MLDRSHSTMPSERRMALESLLLPVDHPSMWPDESLETMFADRLMRFDRCREAGVTPPRFAQEAHMVRLRLSACGSCPRCGQLGENVMCAHCRKVDRQPQGETVRLFEPAPTQIAGQMSF